MKFLAILIFFIALPIFGSVTLQNKDSKKYNLYIDHGSSATNTSINSNTTSIACSKKCTIKIKDNGATIKAEDGDKIIIKNGKLSKK